MRITVLSFLYIIVLGAILLTLPIASKSRNSANFLDSLFTSTSATCVTGLTVFNTFDKWSLIGQIIILFLIQIGGLGLVTLIMFFSIHTNKKLGIKNMQIAQEAIGFGNVIDVSTLIKLIIKVSLIIELIGTILLSIRFIPKYGLGYGLYSAAFISISAFCNAGMDILPSEGNLTSLMNFNSDPLVLPVISLLVILGGLGFVVWYDIFLNKSKKTLMLHTKIVLFMTIFLLAFGFLSFLFLEWNNLKTFGNLNFHEKINAAFFQSATLRTAGFYSVDIKSLHGITKTIMIFLMFIGGAPCSTAGGIKVTTFAVIMSTIICFIRGKNDTIISNKRVNKELINKSISIMGIALFATFISTVTIYFTTLNTPVESIDAIFESVSAIGTTGLSVGLSEIAGKTSKLVLVIVMFMGRVGPASLMLAFLRKYPEQRQILPDAKIMIG